ncbi:hypothetical protein UPYG_G00289880 [Umbra pygmaea]|uniref:Uncharacterized protein n=1 Tax=Umbra pygmaea TaxID=75934 RepID=A0ABD0W958_UMBPY
MLIFFTEEKSDPKYYTLKSKDDNTTACLATDFSTHNATHNSSLLWGDAIRAKGEKDYSQVALISKESKSLCPETNSEENTNEEWPFETDEKINFLSLTMLVRMMPLSPLNDNTSGPDQKNNIFDY